MVNPLRVSAIIKKLKRARLVLITAAIVITAVSAVLIAEVIIDADMRYVPDYARVDLKSYAVSNGDDLSDEDYEILFRQTGLGRDAVDAVFSSARNPAETLEEYQEDFFTECQVICKQIGIVTSEEHLYDDDRVKQAYVLADVRAGDIFVTRATHSVGWRHGHAAIVIDAQNGKTLEAVLLGLPTTVQNVSKWRTFPTFIQLRHKNKELGEEAAVFAERDLTGVDYGLFTGLIAKDREKPDVTQCAHLPWYAYMRLGYDIDGDGGWLVTPKDLVNSDELEIVQIYGVDPGKVW